LFQGFKRDVDTLSACSIGWLVLDQPGMKRAHPWNRLLEKIFDALEPTSTSAAKVVENYGKI